MKVYKKRFSTKRDNLVIRGYEYKTDGKHKPIAIICHGFMANLNTVKHYAKFLAKLGYAAYCFDFSGGSVILGRSDGKTTDMSVLSEVEDLLSVIEYTCSLSYTDKSDILLMGCSQGGFVAALAAALLKDRINKLILFYPALCIPDDARSGTMMAARFDPKNIPDIIWCGPMKLGRCYVESVIDMDPYKEISGYNNDVLIVHGTNDKIVDIEYARKALDIYNHAVYYEIEGGRHMFSKKHDITAMNYLKEFISYKEVN